GVGGTRLLADVGVPEDVQPLRVRRHEAVLDAVVDHLHEMAGTTRAAVEVALLGSATASLTTRSRRERPTAGGERREQRIEPADDVAFAADHETVSALAAPDAAARPAVDVVNPACLETLRAIDVVAVIGIHAVDDDVVRDEP